MRYGVKLLVYLYTEVRQSRAYSAAELGVVFAQARGEYERVDAVVETPCGLYVFEFKLNETAAEALAQIKEKGYHEKYLRAGKKLTLAGVAFDAEMRNLSDRRVEVVAE